MQINAKTLGGSRIRIEFFIQIIKNQEGRWERP